MDVRSRIQRDIFEETLRLFDKAAAEGLAESGKAADDMFLDEIRRNNAVFSAFRTHRMQNDLASRLLDEDGNLKSFDRWVRDVRGMTSHYCGSWLRTEYDTAVIRAHRAADWRHFEDEADVFPNVRWMPTTSPNQDPLHRQYWEARLTLPVNHPFWNDHRPGDRWNCKCSLRQTDEPADDSVICKFYPVKAQPGLDNNPAADGKLFSDSHPYYTKAYHGAEKAVETMVRDTMKRNRSEEESNDIQERWNQRRKIRKMAKTWAEPIPEGAMKSDAEQAAEIILKTFGKDYKLPRISVSDLGKKTKRGLVLADYSNVSDTIRINGNKTAMKEYVDLSRKSVEWGWHSQKNTILHELSHQVHSKYDGKFSYRGQESVRLDRKYIKKNLSEYAAANASEYEAELISGILSGKKYPDRIIAQSVFARDKGQFGKILVDRGRDLSPEAVSARRAENRALAKDLEEWYKGKMPETTVGNNMARRFTVQRVDGETVIVNKTFYNKMISSYNNDLFYADKLDKARIAHNLIQDARYVRTEKPEHEKHSEEMFKVYERVYDDIVYEFKVKVTSDERFLYYMKRK